MIYLRPEFELRAHAVEKTRAARRSRLTGMAQTGTIKICSARVYLAIKLILCLRYATLWRGRKAEGAGEDNLINNLNNMQATNFAPFSVSTQNAYVSIDGNWRVASPNDFNRHIYSTTERWEPFPPKMKISPKCSAFKRQRVSLLNFPVRWLLARPHTCVRVSCSDNTR